jgi:hypothetical protein
MFNDRLLKLPERQRKTDDRRPGFTYMIASSDKLNQFLRQFQQQTNTPSTYQLSPPPAVIKDADIPVTTPERKEETVPVIIEVE